VVHDHLTCLIWTKNANIHQYPLAWDEAFALVGPLNRSGHGGFCGWRLPNRRELASLLSYQSKRPALPAAHPFINVFPGWYWTSTTASINTRYAWAVNMDGARMFYGAKNQEYLLWPVRGVSEVLLRTWQRHSYSSSGQEALSLIAEMNTRQYTWTLPPGNCRILPCSNHWSIVPATHRPFPPDTASMMCRTPTDHQPPAI